MGPDLPADSLEPAPRSYSGHFALIADGLEALLVAVLLACFARAFIVQAFRIPTGSMRENLLVGDHVLVNKFIYGSGGNGAVPLLPMREIRRGDVVVFKFPEDPTRDYVKRCLGLPGDLVEIRDKRLLINGEGVEESRYVSHSDPRTYPHQAAGAMGLRDNYPPSQVPAAHYFCLGDNRDSSLDSRFWGPVPATYIKGRAMMIYWSSALPSEVARDGSLPAPSGSKLGRLFSSVARFLTGVRWDRCFTLVR